MRSGKVRISVVMPHYNQQHLVKNAINSIVKQTFEDWELIIVDDGSDQYTMPTIVDEFKDDRIKLYSLPHNGLVSARNIGCEMAIAPIIVTQDADDIAMVDRLEKIFEHMGDADVLVHSLYLHMWDKEHDCIYREYRQALPIDIERLKKEQYLNGVPAFKKDLWQKLPFRYETQYAYDWMMHLDWVLSGAKYKILDIGLYEYIRHEKSASTTFEKDGRRQEAFTKIQEIIKKEYE